MSLGNRVVHLSRAPKEHSVGGSPFDLFMTGNRPLDSVGETFRDRLAWNWTLKPG